jgi:mRNA interferase MazF
MRLGRGQRRGGVVKAPERGALIWLTFTPQSGPALVVSPSAYNSKVGLALVCPITSKVKGYPFEVPLPDGGPVQGVVLADQLRSLDWRSRQADIIGTAPMAVLERVLQLVETLLSSP